MNTKMPQATHSGKIIIGDMPIRCAVLEDDTAILRERSIARILGKRGGGSHWLQKRTEKGALLPEYLSAKNLEEFIDKETRELLINPISYREMSGKIAKGFPATLLPKICNIWLEAREKGALLKPQRITAKKAEILVRGLADVGIVALVYEATGYQEAFDRKALQALLDRYLRKEFAAWAKTFPDEFYKQIFRLKNWQWKGMKINRPGVVGTYTNDVVYERLAPGVLKELQARNPKDIKGNRKAKHFQWLTEDVGHPALAQHLHAVMGLMRASANWRNFYGMLQRAFPKKNEQLIIPED